MIEKGQRYKSQLDGKTREIVKIGKLIVTLKCVDCHVIPPTIKDEVDRYTFEFGILKGIWKLIE